MDGRLAAGAFLAVPLFYALLLWLTTALPPAVGWGLGLAAYWAGLGAALLAVGDRHALADLLVAESPGRLIWVALVAPIVVMGALALRTLGQVIVPPHLILAAALAALATAVLEELFWRGALLPRPTPRAAAGALGLYALFNLAWLGLRGIETGLDPRLLLMAPLALGGAWTAARLATGTLGAAVLSHAGVNLFLFVQVVALDWRDGAAPPV